MNERYSIKVKKCNDEFLVEVNDSQLGFETKPKFWQYVESNFFEDKVFIILGFLAALSVGVLKYIKEALPKLSFADDVIAVGIIKDHLPITSIALVAFLSGMVSFVSLIFPNDSKARKGLLEASVHLNQRLTVFSSVLVNVLLGFSAYLLIVGFQRNESEYFALVGIMIVLALEMIILSYVMHSLTYEFISEESYSSRIFYFLISVLIVFISLALTYILRA